MKKCYRIFYIIFSLVFIANSLLLLVPNEPVKADNDFGQGNISDSVIASFINTANGNKITVDTIKGWVYVLQIEGYSNQAIAGILSNCVSESGLNPLREEGSSGNGGGLFQFTPITSFSNSAYNTNCNHTKGTCQGASICSDGSCQVAYMISVFNANYNQCISKYNTWRVKPEIQSLTLTSAATRAGYKGSGATLVPITSITDTASFKSTKNEMEASVVFALAYERSWANNCPVGGLSVTGSPNWTNCTYGDAALNRFSSDSDTQVRAGQFAEWMGEVKATPGDGGNLPPGAEDEADDIVEQLYKGHYYGEEELSAYCIMSESPDLYTKLTGKTLESLSPEDVAQIAYWEQGERDINDKGGLTYVLRTIIMAFGILLVIWAMLFYTAYWVDTLNNIFDFSFINLLSFGRLVVSPDPEESTYGKNTEKGAKSTVNHLDVIRICLVALGFGVLILTGVLYKLIFWLIITVTNLLKRIF